MGKQAPLEFKAEADAVSKNLMLAKKRPISFALAIAKPGVIFEADIKKPPETLKRQAKSNGGTANAVHGTMQVSGKLIEFTCLDAKIPGNILKVAKVYFKSLGLKYQLALISPDGTRMGDEPEPDNAVDQATLVKRFKMAQSQLGGLPQPMAAKLTNGLRQVAGSIKANDLAPAAKLLDQIEQAIKTAPANPGPSKPETGETLQKRVALALKTGMPAILTVIKSEPQRKSDFSNQIAKIKIAVKNGDAAAADAGLIKLTAMLREPAAPKVQPLQQTPKPTAPPRPKKAAPMYIDGVDFTDDTKMKGLNEKIYEEAQAQVYMIEQRKKKQGSDPVWDKFEKDFRTAMSALMKAYMERKPAFAANDQKLVQAAFEGFQDQTNKIRKLTDDLKKQWIADQRQAVSDESNSKKKKKRPSSSEKMLANYGEEFLVNAKIAEVMAKNIGFDPYKASKNGVKKPMEMGEVAAIYGYSTQDYAKLNAQLRGNPDPDPAKKDAIDEYVGACVSGLKKLPTYKKSVVRCDKTADFFMAELTSKGQRTARAFLSTGEKLVPAFGKIETYISKVKSGKDISAFSLHQSEKEILFPPGSVFKFKKFIAKDGTVVTDHKKLTAHVDKNTTEGKFYYEQSK